MNKNEKDNEKKGGILRTSNASTLFLRLASFSITLNMMVVRGGHQC